MGLPDLSLFYPYKEIDEVDLDGVVIPGLSAGFHRRPAGGPEDRVRLRQAIASRRRELLHREWQGGGERDAR